jgi:hypothetical protein
MKKKQKKMKKDWQLGKTGQKRVSNACWNKLRFWTKSGT